MKFMIKCSLVLVLFLIFSGTVLAEQNDSGREGELARANQTLHKTRITTVLPDGDQPLVTEHASGLSSKEQSSDVDREQAPRAPIASIPLWMTLDNLSSTDKENAQIQLEVPHDLPAIWLKQVKEIEELWNAGNFNQAVERLRSLEESKKPDHIAVGISWKEPRMISGYKWGTDVQIESRLSISKPCLDFDSASGNLFAVLKRNEGISWTVNLSSDGGQTWQETYAWNAGAGDSAIDLGAVVVAGYLYVGYFASNFTSEARMRRLFANNGSSDVVYNYRVVFDKGVNIREIALTSNADSYDNRIYYWAILDWNGDLVYYWDVATDGTTWTEVATGIYHALQGLDVCSNAGYSNYYLWASYADFGDSLHVVRISAGGIEDIEQPCVVVSPGLSIGAYDDRIMVVFEYLDDDIRYLISYNGGDSWAWGWIAYSADEPPYFHKPDVTARKGGGFAVIYEDDVGGAPDSCYYRRRDYDNVNWTVPKAFNENEVSIGYPMSIEWIPPAPGYCHGYGSIWLGSSTAYFDRHDFWIPGNANGDNQVDVGDVVHLVNYLFKSGPTPDPLLLGDANGDETVDVGDVVYLINYLFKGGPAPSC